METEHAITDMTDPAAPECLTNSMPNADFDVLAVTQQKLVDALHWLEQVPVQRVPHYDRALRALRETLSLVSDADESEVLGPIDWPKFGERLRVRREASGLTQEGLAYKVGVTGTTIRNLEQSKKKGRRGLMLRLLALPDLDLRVSDIEITIQRTATGRWKPGSWLGPTYDPVELITHLSDTLNSPSGQLEQTYVYLDTQSAKDWIATSTSPEYERAYRSHVPFDAMAQCIAKTIGDRAITVCALGSGDGKTEAMLCSALQKHVRYPDQTEVFLLDISHALLNAASRYFEEKLPRVKTYTVHGNFHDMPSLPMLYGTLAGRRRLHIMLGHTTANLDDEVRFFRDTLHCCPKGELFLLDLALPRAPAHDREAIRRAHGVARPSHSTWLSGPIRRYCDGADEVNITCELAPAGGIPGSYGMDYIATVRMRDGRPDRRFLMQRTRRYEPTQFADSLAEIGWKMLERMDSGPDNVHTQSLLLLQKQ
jgi:transcriptional regulator with XRE-family HTH domain